MTGTLTIKAWVNGEEVAAEVEIVGVGKYHTPVTLSLPEGEYILIARWMGQEQIKPAQVFEGKQTIVDFYFMAISETLAYFYAATSIVSLIISIIGLWITATKK